MSFTETRTSRRSLLEGVFATAAALVLASSPASADTPAAADEVSIAFLGDSMVDGLWGGMTRLVSKHPCLVSKVKLLRFGENGTGLTRPAKFDWIKEAKTIVEARKPTLSILSIGLNDRQSIVDGKRARFDLGTPGWRKRYGELVAAFATAAGQTPGGAILLGIPVLRDAVSQEDAAEKNTIFAAAIGDLHEAKIQYLPPWRQESAATDTFQPYGPDVNGSRVQIRAGDGLHFTPLGYDVIAKYVFDHVVEHLRANNIPLSYPCGA